MRTDLYAVKTKEEPRENHLAESEHRSKGGEECDGYDAKQVHEENCEDGVDKTEAKHRSRQGSDRK